MLKVIIPSRRSQLSFHFNHIFNENTSQEQLFESVGDPLVQEVLKGFNCTLFAYGQTGSGKTYSLLGSENLCSISISDQHQGLIIRCMKRLFMELGKKMNNRSTRASSLPSSCPDPSRESSVATSCSTTNLNIESEKMINDSEKSNCNIVESSVTCSFVEIYQSKIRDLLVGCQSLKNRQLYRKPPFGQSASKNSDRSYVKEATIKAGYPLSLKHNKRGEVFVSHLTQEKVSNVTDVMKLISVAQARRVTCATDMNEHSSRSHWLMIVTLHQRLSDGSIVSSKINFADLAGSEKIRKTGVQGSALDEAKKINHSLHMLRKCISSLAKVCYYNELFHQCC